MPGERCRCPNLRAGETLSLLDGAIEVVALATAIWVFAFQLPKARRDQDPFALICSLLTGLLALVAWLFVGIRLQSG
jgi:hypothetical protein